MSGQHDAVAHTGDPTESDDTFALDCTDSLDLQEPCDPSSSLAPGDIVQAPRLIRGGTTGSEESVQIVEATTSGWIVARLGLPGAKVRRATRDGAEGWAVPAALAEAYTCTVTVTHALRSARLYSGRPSLVCASRDDCVVFDERRLPPLFSPPDPSSWQDEEQEAGFSLVRVDPAHDVRCRAHLSHAGGRGAGGGHLELDFGNETGRLNGRQALLEYLLLLTARVAG